MTRPVNTPADQSRTISHHLDHITHNLNHAGRHIEVIQKNPKGPTTAGNSDHVADHIAETRKAVEKLKSTLEKKLPQVKKENVALKKESQKGA